MSLSRQDFDMPATPQRDDDMDTDASDKEDDNMHTDDANGRSDEEDGMDTDDGHDGSGGAEAPGSSGSTPSNDDDNTAPATPPMQAATFDITPRGDCFFEALAWFLRTGLLFDSPASSSLRLAGELENPTRKPYKMCVSGTCGTEQPSTGAECLLMPPS